jgi:hypothetical protein
LIWLYQFFGNHLHDLSFPDKRDLSDATITPNWVDFSQCHAKDGSE